MNFMLLMITLFTIAAAILSITVSSIAIESYNSDKRGTELKNEKPNNFNFIIVNLVVNILIILSGCVSLYYNITSLV